MAMINKLEKASAILEELTTQARVITREIKEMPQKNRYWFRRDTSRGASRRSKRRKMIALMKIGMATASSCARIAMIKATPIPKYDQGGSIF